MRASVAVAVTACTALMLAATPAQAAIGKLSGKLSITDACGPGFPHLRLVTVRGVAQMSRIEAQNKINANWRVWMEGWGDDWADNKEFGPHYAQGAAALWAAPDGLHFKHSTCERKSDLNEDPYDGDELFVKLELHSPSIVKKGKTDTLRGEFG